MLLLVAVNWAEHWDRHRIELRKMMASQHYWAEEAMHGRLWVEEDSFEDRLGAPMVDGAGRGGDMDQHCVQRQQQGLVMLAGT
jgi:hypothetical protein